MGLRLIVGAEMAPRLRVAFWWRIKSALNAYAFEKCVHKKFTNVRNTSFLSGASPKNLAFISLKACVTKNRIFCKSDDAWMKKGRGAEEKIAKIGRMWKMRLLFNIWAF